MAGDGLFDHVAEKETAAAAAFELCARYNLCQMPPEGPYVDYEIGKSQTQCRTNVVGRGNLHVRICDRDHSIRSEAPSSLRAGDDITLKAPAIAKSHVDDDGEKKVRPRSKI